MEHLQLAAEMHSHQLQQARQLYFAQGESPEGLIKPLILRSWQRCRHFGLRENGQPAEVAVVDQPTLKREQERNQLLLSHAWAVMGLVHEQIGESASQVILADANGLLLETLGDADFAGQTGRLALAPGTCWEESRYGTNAIGTALVEENLTQVLGGEHFLERNAFLAACASPVFAADGTLLGIFSIASDYAVHEPHTRGLVGLSAALIENRLFAATHARDILLGFQRRGASLGSPNDGLAAVTPDGQVRAVNRTGLEILGRRRVDAVNRDFAQLFEYRLGLLIDHLRQDPQGSHELVVGGKPLRVQLRGQLPPLLVVSRSRPATAAARSQPRSPEATPATLTLDILDSGDPGLHAAIGRARRILDRDIPLLIQGESGAGKELFAKGFHNSGARRSAPFVALNCAAIPENLIEAELFGYQGGAYTGARKEGAPGKIQQAHGGTLFLDEIGDMPLALQSRLLRVLQERCVTPLGATHCTPLDISLVCATHRRLREEVARGTFREDLYYRLNGLCVTLPALRQRTDIRLLVAQLAERETIGRAPVQFSEAALQTMERYAWPGNLRQLFNVIRVLVALLDDDETVISREQLPDELLEQVTVPAGQQWSAAAPEVNCSLDEIGYQLTRRALDAAGGN
ncbi:MAG: sigma-54-dependent Fis family transcriptional regulator, partial [Betaproteobacteria bacterium HGW-Betaproteobacteria-12]